MLNASPIRASFSQERVTYVATQDSLDGIAKVIYESKDVKTSKTFEALDWLAQLTTHIPNKGEQMVRYYRFYSNKSRGLRKKVGTDDEVPGMLFRLSQEGHMLIRKTEMIRVAS